MNIPKIVVKPIILEKNIDLVTKFISPTFNKKNKTLPFAKRSYELFPELIGKINDNMADEEVKKVVAPVVENKLNEYKDLIEKKLKIYNLSLMKLMMIY